MTSARSGWTVTGLSKVRQPDYATIQEADIVLVGTWVHGFIVVGVTPWGLAAVSQLPAMRGKRAAYSVRSRSIPATVWTSSPARWRRRAPMSSADSPCNGASSTSTPRSSPAAWSRRSRRRLSVTHAGPVGLEDDHLGAEVGPVPGPRARRWCAGAHTRLTAAGPTGSRSAAARRTGRDLVETDAAASGP